MEKLRQDIKSGTFESVYLLYGEETYLVRSYKNQLKEAIIGEDTMNNSYFEGKNVSFEEVADLAVTMPFFAEHRLIMLENTGLFKTAAEGWTELVKNLPESCHLIFVETEIDKRGKLYKAVREHGYCAEMQRQTEKELKRWVVSGLGRQKLGITADALDLFLEKTGEDMENIRMEMEKLVSYCIGKEGVTAADVEEICTERLTNRIFEMIQAVSEGNQVKALELYYDLLALKEPGMRILFLIAKQMNQLLSVKELAASKVSKDAIAVKLKLRPFVVNKLLMQARQFETDKLKACVEQCVSLEEAIKSGNMNERVAVEMVLVSIASRRV